MVFESFNFMEITQKSWKIQMEKFSLITVVKNNCVNIVATFTRFDDALDSSCHLIVQFEFLQLIFFGNFTWILQPTHI